MKRKWFDKKVLILGLSKSGIAAAKYLNSKGADLQNTLTQKAQIVLLQKKNRSHLRMNKQSKSLMNWV